MAHYAYLPKTIGHLLKANRQSRPRCLETLILTLAC